ncbi:CoA transferase [Candidatus Woesearchaeota archaeon]|nr:CoA transferase [Candidatus Woesearchaeota archaeon]
MLLKGVRVLDMSNLLPGPMCSLFLADLGADIIKVESLSGDPMRYFESAKGRSPYFLALNRNKKSIALNLKTDEGKKIFMRLAKNADVVIEGFRPGKVDALGIGYKSLKKINQKIIYCSITGYGQKGAYKNKAGHDLNYAALSGMLDVISAEPFVAGVQIADVSGALVAAFAIVSSLLYREKHGKGNYIDMGVLDATLSVIGMHVAYRSVSENTGTILSGSKPCYNVYRTKDGRFASLGAIEKKFWVNFCNAIGREDLIHRQFDGSRDVMNEVKAVFKSKAMDEWVRLNNKHDFCCEPVRKISEVIKDDYFKSKKMLADIDGIKQVAMPVAFSSFKKLKYSIAPKIGQDTEKILDGIGYNKNEIKKLKYSNVIL